MAPFNLEIDVKNQTDIRCGRSAELAARRTQTATILAGTSGAFRTRSLPDPAPAEDWIYHKGPASVYMAKSDDLGNDVGDGDWFRIAYEGLTEDKKHWENYHQRYVNFTIPATTPPGTYLLRVEHFQPYELKDLSQWFVNCAHVKIVGSGGGSPGPTIKIPDAYHADDPAILLPTDAAGNYLLDQYKPVGPAVWMG